MTEHGLTPCLHEDSVEWNPWNRAVRCYRCGQVIVDVAALEAALENIRESAQAVLDQDTDIPLGEVQND